MNGNKMIGLCLMAISFIVSAEDLTTKDGRTYRNYSVINVTGRGLMIQYQVKRFVPWSRIPDSIREKYEQNELVVQQDKVQSLSNVMIDEISLKKQEYVSYGSNMIKVERVIDDTSCIVSDRHNGNMFVVQDIDTTDLSDGCDLPMLDTYYRNHNFSALLRPYEWNRNDTRYWKRNRNWDRNRIRNRIRDWNIDSDWDGVRIAKKCIYCGYPVPDINDKEKLSRIISDLQKKQCKASKVMKRHRFFYIGYTENNGKRYMLFTVRKDIAMSFVERNPKTKIPPMIDVVPIRPQ